MENVLQRHGVAALDRGLFVQRLEDGPLAALQLRARSMAWVEIGSWAASRRLAARQRQGRRSPALSLVGVGGSSPIGRIAAGRVICPPPAGVLPAFSTDRRFSGLHGNEHHGQRATKTLTSTHLRNMAHLLFQMMEKEVAASPLAVFRPRRRRKARPLLLCPRG